MQKLLFLSTCFLVLSMSVVQAQELEEGGQLSKGSDIAQSKDSIGLFVGNISIDENIAYEEGVDDSGIIIGGAYTGYSSFLRYSVGIGGIIIDDNAQFSQKVKNNFTGKKYTADSSIDAFTLFAEVGSEYSFGIDKKTSIGLMVGYSYFSVERSIANCDDCASQNIDINSSLYYKPFIIHQVSESLSLSVEYNSYLDEQSFDNALSLSINFSS